jgi:hypothetical protein
MVVSAQLPAVPRPAFSVVGGVSQFDLSGTGSTPFAAVRLEVPITAFILEGSLGALRPKEQIGTRTYIVPEAQLQWQLFPIVIHPYLGAGVGWFRAVSGPDPHPNDLTVSASGGVRVNLPFAGLRLRGELRVRGIGPGFTGSAAEWTVGLGR